MLDREIEYQATLNQQRQELEKLLQEKEKLLEAQRQLSAIARTTLNQTQVDGGNISQKVCITIYISRSLLFFDFETTCNILAASSVFVGNCF